MSLEPQLQVAAHICDRVQENDPYGGGEVSNFR